jgi:hypothetical protein
MKHDFQSAKIQVIENNKYWLPIIRETIEILNTHRSLSGKKDLG